MERSKAVLRDLDELDRVGGGDGTPENATGNSTGDGTVEITRFRLSSANSLWPDDGVDLSEGYTRLVNGTYDAELNTVDYGSPKEARRRINGWVANETEDEIQELLPRGSITRRTRLVLANAVYFSVKWREQFQEENTETGTFTSLNGEENEVEMMKQTSDEFSYAEVDGHKLVELPYANERTSMVIILPAEGEFERFESELTVERLGKMISQTGKAEVDLKMPKFRMRYERELKPVLRSMGMERFGTELGGIDAVFHKATVGVNEKGTEASAATAVAVSVNAELGPERKVSVSVDRPFLFYIRDRPTETPLFLGRVTDGGFGGA
jgi:serpin B